MQQARGESRKLIEDARAFKAERINQAEGQASKFTSMLVEYQKAPDITRQRLLYEAMEEVLPGITKFIVDSETGILPPIAFTQTLIKLNDNPLPIKYLKPSSFSCFFKFSNAFFFINF